jgi:hypothetical protein
MKKINLKINNYLSSSMNSGFTKVSARGDVGFNQKIFNYLLISWGVFSLIYILLLSNIVFNIIERKNFESQVRALSNEVANLEFAYLLASNEIDLKIGHSMGFKETKPNFITRDSLGGVKIAKNEL